MLKILFLSLSFIVFSAKQLSLFFKQTHSREKRPPPPFSRALSHDAPLFANKRGQPIEVTCLKLVVPLVLFCVWKAAHTLTDHLASAVMTEANARSIQNSTNTEAAVLSECKVFRGISREQFHFKQYMCMCGVFESLPTCGRLHVCMFAHLAWRAWTREASCTSKALFGFFFCLT